MKDKGVIRNQVHYLVKWEGWPTEYNQWILEEDIGNTQLAIQHYKLARKKAKAKETATLFPTGF